MTTTASRINPNFNERAKGSNKKNKSKSVRKYPPYRQTLQALSARSTQRTLLSVAVLAQDLHLGTITRLEDKATTQGRGWNSQLNKLRQTEDINIGRRLNCTAKT